MSRRYHARWRLQICEADRYLTIDEALDRMVNDILIAYPDVKEGTV